MDSDPDNDTIENTTAPLPTLRYVWNYERSVIMRWPEIKYLPCRNFQLTVVNWTRPRLHNLSRKPHTNDWNLENDYWEGPVTYGAYVFFPMALCASVMFMYWVYSLIMTTPSRFCVCLLKMLSSLIGLICLLLASIVLYSSPGVLYLWSYLCNWTYPNLLKRRSCQVLDAMSPSKMERLAAYSEESVSMIQEAEKEITSHPGFEQGWANIVDPWQEYKHWGIKLEFDCLPIQSNYSFDKLAEFVEPMCTKDLSEIRFGNYSFFDRIYYFSEIITYGAYSMTIWTMILSFFIAQIVTKRSTIFITFIYILAAVTSICWWALASLIIPIMIGTADYCSRELENMYQLVEQIQPNITDQIIGHYIICDGIYTRNPLDGELYYLHKAHYEASRYARHCNSSYHRFLPEFQKREYVAFAERIIEETSDEVRWLTGIVGQNEDDKRVEGEACWHSRKVYLEFIYKPICQHYFWCLIVTTVVAVILAPLLTLVVIMSLKIQKGIHKICPISAAHGKKEKFRGIVDELVCLPECPRHQHQPLQKRVTKCPPTCPGVAAGQALHSKGLTQRLPIPAKYGVQVEVPKLVAIDIQNQRALVVAKRGKKAKLS